MVQPSHTIWPLIVILYILVWQFVAVQRAHEAFQAGVIDEFPSAWLFPLLVALWPLVLLVKLYHGAEDYWNEFRGRGIR